MTKELFETLNLSPELLTAIAELQYTEMTPIQASAIPLILEGNDVIGRSSTGTGKTAAFGIPLVEKAVPAIPNRPRALILAPTRELAMQISGELRKFARNKPSVRIATIYGGDSMTAQFGQLRVSSIVVGTPGRVMDHMRRGTLDTCDLQTVVLDEADEMLNMGFYEDICEILEKTPETRQTLLFSATMPEPILKLTRQFQKEPKLVAVDGGQRTLDTIEQFYYHIPQDQKLAALNLLLQRHGQDRAVVFCNMRRMVDDVVEYLNANGFNSIGLHGDMNQSVRTRVMSDFKMGRLQVLVATDVAARGIDVENVRAVFNYDIPMDNEYYIHRIGRTGRAGKKGQSHTLASNATQIRRIKELERFVKTPIARAFMPPKEEIYALRQQKMCESVARNMSTMGNILWESVYDSLIEQGYDPRQIACSLLTMSSGLASMDIPNVLDIVPMLRSRTDAPPVRRDSSRSNAPVNDSTRGTGNWVTLQINAGRNQDILPKHLVSAIVKEANIPASGIGRIDIQADITRIDLSPEAAKRVLTDMQGVRIHGCRAKFSLSTAPARKQPPRK